MEQEQDATEAGDGDHRTGQRKPPGTEQMGRDGDEVVERGPGMVELEAGVDADEGQSTRHVIGVHLDDGAVADRSGEQVEVAHRGDDDRQGDQHQHGDEDQAALETGRTDGRSCWGGVVGAQRVGLVRHVSRVTLGIRVRPMVTRGRVVGSDPGGPLDAMTGG